MKELYFKSKKIILERNFDNSKINLNIIFVYIWWIIWLIYQIYGQWVGIVYKNPQTIYLRKVQYLSFCSISLIGIILSIITIKVIKDYAKVESLLIDMKDDIQARIDSIGKN
jgi:hypothetical protein